MRLFIQTSGRAVRTRRFLLFLFLVACHLSPVCLGILSGEGVRAQGARPKSGTPSKPPNETHSDQSAPEQSDAPTNSEIVGELQELVKAVKALRENQQIQTASSFLLVLQSRLQFVEGKLNIAERDLADLKRRQATNLARLDNIDNELIARGFLNRGDGERQIRAEVAAEDGRLLLTVAEADQKRADLQSEHDRIRSRIDRLTEQVMETLLPKRVDEFGNPVEP